MRYLPLELGFPDKPACPDAFNEDSTLFCPGTTRVFIQVGKQAVYLELGIMPAAGSGLGSIVWQGEQTLLPITGSLGRSCDAVRVRNRTPGKEAQVTVTVS